MKAKYASFLRKRSALVEENRYKNNECPVCGGNFIEHLDPLCINIFGEPCDFYAPENYLIISEKFLRLLRDNEVKGYEVRPVTVSSWNKGDISQLPEYYELLVTAHCGLLRDLEGNELIHCPQCGRRKGFTGIKTEGVSFAPESYDPSDIFSFSNWDTMPVVTEKLKKIITKNKISNTSFLNLSEQVFDERSAEEILQEYKAQNI